MPTEEDLVHPMMGPQEEREQQVHPDLVVRAHQVRVVPEREALPSSALLS